MRYIFIILLLSLTTNLKSQVGINTTTPVGSSILDIDSNNKGISLPSYQLTTLIDATNPINQPAEGLLIYNNGTSYPKGIYYWTGIRWDKFHSIGDFNETFAFSLVKLLSNDPEIEIIPAYTGINNSSIIKGYNKIISNNISGNVPASYDTSGNIILPKGKYKIHLKIDASTSTSTTGVFSSTTIQPTGTASVIALNNFGLTAKFTDTDNKNLTEVQLSNNISTGIILGFEYIFWLDLKQTSNTIRLVLGDLGYTRSINQLITSQSGLKLTFTRIQ